MATRVVTPPLIGRRALEDAMVVSKSREAEWTQTTPASDALPTGAGNAASAPPARGAAWVEWCLSLLNANEFVYVD